MEKFSAIDPGKTQEILNMGLKKFGELPLTILTSTTSFLWSSISSLVNILFMLFNLVIIPVAMFYLLRDFDEINKKLTDLIPPRFRNLFVEIFHEIDDVLSNFIRGQLMVATMMAVFYCIGLYFIGTPLSLLIGILAGFANLVPYLGLVFGLLPAALMTFLQYQEWLPVLQVALLFGGVQAVEGFLITPRVVGDKLGLHPVVVMLAVLLGAEFFGFLGIFLAVPVVAVFKVLVDRGLVRYKKSSVYS
ncbi:MAG: AI-2E family transporter, partial [Nitrospinales bacterium]